MLFTWLTGLETELRPSSLTLTLLQPPYILPADVFFFPPKNKAKGGAPLKKKLKASRKQLSVNGFWRSFRCRCLIFCFVFFSETPPFYPKKNFLFFSLEAQVKAVKGGGSRGGG